MRHAHLSQGHHPVEEHVEPAVVRKSEHDEPVSGGSLLHQQHELGNSGSELNRRGLSSLRCSLLVFIRSGLICQIEPSLIKTLFVLAL
eukprot:CAMPEP_0171830946 /NCGR_PEP_ID=MMETSP0992-20121227/8511_1 /TAXON_ID=483369 /ORGANISM="non described non described, Strain CCMP2098" /LENGTH=87 /DNA_ID=CAMNT_0012446317 /DNA_START=202 /DNA_END=465 /DNA_ORIENTATION=-